MGQKNCKSSEGELRCDRDTVNSNVNMLYVGERNFNNKNIEHYQLNGLTCIYTNADSFMNKYDELKLRYINSDKTAPDIIMITEVLPKNSRYKLIKAELSLNGYDMFPDSFPPEEGRGILIYVKQALNAVELKIESNFKEHVWVKINLKNCDKLLVGCLYKSPSSDEENLQELNKLLNQASKLEDRFSHILITVDFNFPKIDWADWRGKDEIDMKFIECIRDCYFDQLVDKPTRYRINQEPSVLDLILVNDKNRVSKIIFDNPLGSSDHCVLKFDYRCYIDYESIISEKYNYFKGDYDKLRNELDSDWQKLLNGKCTEDMIDIFMERLLKSTDTCIPKSKRGKKRKDAAIKRYYTLY